METQNNQRRFTLSQIALLALLCVIVGAACLTAFTMARPSTRPSLRGDARERPFSEEAAAGRQQAAPPLEDPGVAVSAAEDAGEAIEATKTDAAQVGAAFLAYAQDYDEAFPPAPLPPSATTAAPMVITAVTPGSGLREGSDVRLLIALYIRDPGALSPRQGTPDPDNPANPVFVYTFQGGTVPDAAVRTTPLGYKRGPGGRAVIYADGHCEWKADKHADTPQKPRSKP